MKNELRTQSVVVAGLGVTGQASVRFLQAQGAKVKVWDSRANASIPDTLSVPVCRGEPSTDYFDDVDVLIVSPGIDPTHPTLEKARSRGVEVIGDVELFARFNRVPTVGVTGSNGKTTVTLLTKHILCKAGLRAEAAGNVGRAALDTLAMPLDAVVLELSSFQLETTASLELQAGCLLNLSDDHLDRHRTMEAYLAAKQRLFLNCDSAIVWRGQDLTRPAHAVKHIVSYGLNASPTDFGVNKHWITFNGEPVFDTRRSPLTGSHNILNVQAAIALAMSLGVSVRVASEAVYDFEPAPHRCVEIANRDGVRFIDDSKATNAGATLAAIEGLAGTRHGRILLIAGGDAKGADLTVLQSALRQHVAAVYAIGKDASQFVGLHSHTQKKLSLEEAVRCAADDAQPGDIVLLSPACASLDMFDNYMHRAQVFADAVSKLEVTC